MSKISRKKRKAKLREAERKIYVVSKLTGRTSCSGCQYLYLQDYGYSNYTVIDSQIHCALDMNPKLVRRQVEIPYDWQRDMANGITDRWEPTRDGICEKYRPLPPGKPMAQFDVDGDTTVEDVTVGFSGAARRAIRTHVGK